MLSRRFVMTTSQYPFGFDGPRKMGGVPVHQVYRNIRDGHAAVKFPEKMSSELKTLLRGIFIVDPSERWKISQIRSSAWFRGELCCRYPDLLGFHL